jgi:hypothetical protein
MMVSTLYSPQRTLERHESDQNSKHVPHEYKYSELTNAKSNYSERQKHKSAHQEHYLLDVRLILSICRDKSQLDATQWFIELIIRSTCFGHYYAHHQELETIQSIRVEGLLLEQQPSTRTHSLQPHTRPHGQL